MKRRGQLKSGGGLSVSPAGASPAGASPAVNVLSYNAVLCGKRCWKLCGFSCSPAVVLSCSDALQEDCAARPSFLPSVEASPILLLSC